MEYTLSEQYHVLFRLLVRYGVLLKLVSLKRPNDIF